MTPVKPCTRHQAVWPCKRHLRNRAHDTSESVHPTAVKACTRHLGVRPCTWHLAVRPCTRHQQNRSLYTWKTVHTVPEKPYTWHLSDRSYDKVETLLRPQLTRSTYPPHLCGLLHAYLQAVMHTPTDCRAHTYRLPCTHQQTAVHTPTDCRPHTPTDCCAHTYILSCTHLQIVIVMHTLIDCRAHTYILQCTYLHAVVHIPVW